MDLGKIVKNVPHRNFRYGVEQISIIDIVRDSFRDSIKHCRIISLSRLKNISQQDLMYDCAYFVDAKLALETSKTRFRRDFVHYVKHIPTSVKFQTIFDATFSVRSRLL